jgi:hypothetical protein
MSIKKLNDIIGNRTRDHPTAPPHTPKELNNSTDI